MANKFYPSAKQLLMNGGIDLDTDTFKLALVTSSYTAADAHDFFDDITGEVSATGYTAGGETVANKTVTLDATTGKFTFDPIVWTITGGITYRGAVLYKSTGTAATSALVAFYDFTTDQVLAGNGTATVSPHSTGAVRLA